MKAGQGLEQAASILVDGLITLIVLLGLTALGAAVQGPAPIASQKAPPPGPGSHHSPANRPGRSRSSNPVRGLWEIATASSRR